MKRFWFIYNIVLIAVLIYKLWYTYNKKAVEEKIGTGYYMICPKYKKAIFKNKGICPYYYSNIHSLQGKHR